LLVKNIFGATIIGGRTRLRVIFMGTPQFAVPSLEHLALDEYRIMAVYSQPDRKVGRGLSLVSSPVKSTAENLSLTVVQPPSFKEPEVVAELASFHPDVIVVAAFGQILPQLVLNIPTHGCINIHPSLLPRFRGSSPVAAAILAGDEFTGVSIMLMDKGMDTGPILTRAQIPISTQDTTGLLATKLSVVAAQLLLEVLPCWCRGEITPRTQDKAEATYTSQLSKEGGEIDWHLPAVDIWRQVRAFQPWPGCYTRWQGKQLKIIEAVPLPEEKSFKVGEVVALGKEGAVFGINTGEGVLGILQVQLEGKRAMTAAEFQRGQRQLIGTIVPLK